MYTRLWAAMVGEKLACEREPTNPTDRCAVAVVKSGIIIGHLPRMISKVCWLSINVTHCQVNPAGPCWAYVTI